jgi:hypothetical protein
LERKRFSDEDDANDKFYEKFSALGCTFSFAFYTSTLAF